MIIVIAAIISSCSGPSASDGRINYIRRDSFPQNPVNGQRYYNNGHSWFYDYAAMRWVMNGSNGGGNYYYYPLLKSYKNSSGVVVNNEQAYRGAHPGSFTSGKASTPTRSGVFGSKGHSISVHS